jgi:hypothetical protein
VRSINLFTTKEQKMKKKLFALSGVFLIALVTAGLWATTATDINGVQQATAPTTSQASVMSMQQMTQEASAIVIGTCVATQSQWVGRSLVTQVTISVEEALKGNNVGTTLTIDVPGGVDYNRKHPIAMTYAGAPQFSLDEKTFLFLTGPVESASSYTVIGFSQGKFSIGNATDGEPVVTRDMTKAPMPKVAGLTRGNPQVVSLSELKALVRSYLNQ